jgi:ABC-2 type transport system permease protein
MEISNNDDRKKENLPKKPLTAAITDSSKYNNTYISDDADWINFETIVSTTENQIAIAPGYLQKEWKVKNRRYFHYKMNAPILNFYAYLSAEYQVKKDHWQDVNIEIYYQKGHEYNIDRMIVGIKHALIYYTKNFGPYQHKQARIIEFPAYASFAQAFPNTIPYSESIGFILDINDPNTIDAVYYVTAHEMAHQWWAHQVIGAPVDGMTVFSETMSQYSALMVMKKQFGKEKMKKFLAYELDKYQSDRGREREKEQPLLFNQNQPYLHYNKGSVVMYALQDLIGEEKVNLAARNFIEKYKFKAAPYPNALDFYSFIQAETPDSLKQMVDDLFLRITVFNNSCKKATVKETNDKKYLVTVELELQKFYADSVGNEKLTPLNDWIDIGAVDENEHLLFSTKVKATQNKMTYHFLINKKPYKAGIDPLNQLIDKDGDDNLVKVN